MVFHLPSIWTISIDIIVWLFIHVGVSASISRKNEGAFNPESWLYRERDWEKNGKIYQSILQVKGWKGLLPDGAALFRNSFRKKRLKKPDAAYVQRFIIETCRAELTHWIVFAFSVIFFIWNIWWVGIIMIAYAFMVNIPCVITQRYNRIRLKRFLVATNKHGHAI